MLRIMIITTLLIYLGWSAPAEQKFQSCLPKGITMETVVSAMRVRHAGPPSKTIAGQENNVRKITVRDKLIELKARCKRGKLVDAAGKEIVFYRLKGCWGNPPQDYLEILQRQSEELEKLRKKYTVIELTCNPSGQMIV